MPMSVESGAQEPDCGGDGSCLISFPKGGYASNPACNECVPRQCKRCHEGVPKWLHDANGGRCHICYYFKSRNRR